MDELTTYYFNNLNTITMCRDNEHKTRDNEFGITWCTKCGRLFTKPSGKPFIRPDKLTI